MNRSNIEWTKFTSNPIKGKCRHFGTPTCGNYCYAERIRKRFHQPAEMSWHPEELEAIKRRKKPSMIFMGSVYDIFGEWVPEDWILQILNTIRDCPQHQFLFLTKNPVRYSDFTWFENCYCGVTDDCATSDTFPLDDFGEWITSTRKFISFEPLLGKLGTMIPADIDGIIIGAMTGKGAVPPKREWVEEIIEEAGDRKVFLKDNLLKIYPDLPRLRETAWKL